MYKGLGVDGAEVEVGVGAKIAQAAMDGARIINLSLGLQTVGDVPPMGIKNGIEQAIAHNQDILIVCAAGNFGDTKKVWPAAFSLEFPNVVAVAGLNPQLGPAAWSSHGNFVEISTVAEGIVSTYVEGTEDRVVDNPPDTFGPNAFALWSGTSFAAPQIVGKVATICLRDNVTPIVAIETLKTNGTLIPGYGVAVEVLQGT